MHVTVKELLQLGSLQGFALVAGKGGLSRPVSSAGILDYEGADVALARSEVFAKDSFVLSSLLFAKDSPERLLPAIQRLVADGASGLAYKSVIFGQLPAEVLAYADAHHFPIFCFADGDGIYFENIIYEIMARAASDEDMLALERAIDRLVHQNLAREEVQQLCARLFRSPARHCQAAFVAPAAAASLSFGSLLNSFARSGTDREHITVCRYQDLFAVLMTRDDADEGKFSVVLHDVLQRCGLQKGGCLVSLSGVHVTKQALDHCLREAWHTALANAAEQAPLLCWRDIGTYRFLAPLRSNPHMTAFSQQYLAPLAGHEELLQTAIAWVRAAGDAEEAARHLFLHKNTVRYRIKKCRELLGPAPSDSVFFEQLAAAVRVHLLRGT